ncbi:MAG: hypothetical protein JXD23_15430 [Spirochaetales bacterium]|nr:hypothetical protein [Spirochaetales bacterium]
MKHLCAVVLILHLVALSFSCNEGTNTLFDNIIHDTQVSDNNQLGNTAKVPSITKFNGDYFAATGVIRWRNEGDTVWSTLTLASGLHNTVATDGVTYLYAGILYNDGTGSLYQCSNPTSAPSSGSISVTDLKNILKIRNFGSSTPYDVYASYGKTDGTFSICNISGTTATEDPGVAGISPSLTDSINNFDYQGGTLYFVSGTKVYRGATLLTPSTTAHTYTGIMYDTVDSRILVSTNDGYILRSTDATGTSTPWEQNSEQCIYNNGSTDLPVPFTEIVPLDSNLYLVGSRGAGFWIIDWTVADAKDRVKRWNGSSYSDLYNGSIESIFIDASAGPRGFFCTIGAGLWDNTITVTLNSTPPPTYNINYGDPWTRE